MDWFLRDKNISRQWVNFCIAFSYAKEVFAISSICKIFEVIMRGSFSRFFSVFTIQKVYHVMSKYESPMMGEVSLER